MRPILLQPDISTPIWFRKWAGAVIAFFDRHRAEPKFTVGAEAANTRRVTIQVVDRLGRDVRNKPWVGFIFVSTASTGIPSGTQTAATVTGTSLQTLLANQAAIVCSDAEGKYEIDITVVGASSRWVGVAIDGEVMVSQEIAWT